jgi:hypothetical protein
MDNLKNLMYKYLTALEGEISKAAEFEKTRKYLPFVKGYFKLISPSPITKGRYFLVFSNSAAVLISSSAYGDAIK